MTKPNSKVKARCPCWCHAPSEVDDTRDDSWEYGVPCVECMENHNPELSKDYLCNKPNSPTISEIKKKYLNKFCRVNEGGIYYNYVDIWNFFLPYLTAGTRRKKGQDE
jgi:hypothetical protein